VKLLTNISAIFSFSTHIQQSGLSAIGNDIIPDLVSIFDRDLGFLQRAWFQSLIGIYGFSRYIVRGESLPIKGFKP
jgi:hypothetical protein